MSVTYFSGCNRPLTFGRAGRKDVKPLTYNRKCRVAGRKNMKKKKKKKLTAPPHLYFTPLFLLVYLLRLH